MQPTKVRDDGPEAQTSKPDNVRELWLEGGRVRRDSFVMKDGKVCRESTVIEVPEYEQNYRQLEDGIGYLHRLGYDLVMETISYESGVSMQFMNGPVGSAMLRALLDGLGS